MRKINLAITGCMGRMGKHIIKSARSDKNFKIVTLTENRIIKKSINGIKPSLNNAEAFKKANLIIDFSVPKCTLEVLKISSKLKKKVEIGKKLKDRSLNFFLVHKTNLYQFKNL